MAKTDQKVIVATGVNPGNPSGLSELDPKAISSMPLAQYYTMQNNFVNTQAAVYYDTAVYAAGTAITPQHVAKLFTKGKNQGTSVVQTGTAIAEKGAFMTNMIGDGEFEGGVTFLLEQIVADIWLNGERVTTVGTKGDIQVPTVSPLATYSASAHIGALRDQFELVYLRNEEPKLRGTLAEFPSPFIVSGAFGSSLGGFVQNGFTRTWNKLSRVPVLQSEDKFSVEIRPLSDTFTPDVPFRIKVAFIGQVIKTFIP
jgi:hypothetical protein